MKLATMRYLALALVVLSPVVLTPTQAKAVMIKGNVNCGNWLNLSDPDAEPVREQIKAMDGWAGGAAQTASVAKADAKSTPPAEEAPFSCASTLPAGNDESWFDPHLISQSRVEYEVDGARIIGLRITTSDRRQVNNIAHGNSYQFAYEVEFLNRFISIQFAMLIKTVNGVEITGSHAFPPEEGIDVESGQRYFVRFPFEAVFLPGTYFCNAGVFTQKGGFKQPHRIIDSTAFRVMAGAAAVGRMGMVNAFMRSTNPPPVVLSDRAENVG